MSEQKSSPPDFGPSLQRRIYGTDAIEHYHRSKLVNKFLERWAARRLGTSRTYRTRLANLSFYVYRQHDKMELDSYVELLKTGKLDVYEELAGLLVWIQSKRHETMKIAPSTAGLTIVTAKKFLRASGVRIDRDDFIDRVPLPKRHSTEKAALTKADVISILNACRQMRLKTVVLFLASTGARALESMSVRVKDLAIGDDTEQPTVTFRPETTKTGEGRTVPLTKECAGQLRLWLKAKYRPHYSTGKFVTPVMADTDLLFSMWHTDGSNPDVQMLYDTVRCEFNPTLEMIGRGQWEDSGKRRMFTMHSFRRHVKTTISNAGYYDFSEMMLGHKSGVNVTYFRMAEADRNEMWRKVEPFLTYLDASAMMAHGQDMQAKIDAMQKRYEDELAKVRAETQQEVLAMKAALIAKSALMEALTPAITKQE